MYDSSLISSTNTAVCSWTDCRKKRLIPAHFHGKRLVEIDTSQQKYGLKACSLAQIIEHRQHTEQLVIREEVVKLPTNFGDSDC